MVAVAILALPAKAENKSALLVITKCWKGTEKLVLKNWFFGRVSRLPKQLVLLWCRCANVSSVSGRQPGSIDMSRLQTTQLIH
jgi:hypothetical protein